MPVTSSDLPKAGGPRQRFVSVLLRMGFTCAPAVTSRAVVSYTALPPLPGKPGGTFLLHCPWSRLHQTLSGILPCEARTFLTCIKQPRSSILLTLVRLYLFPGKKSRKTSRKFPYCKFPCKLFRTTFAKSHLTMLPFCSCGYFVISNRAYSCECEHSTYMSDSHDSE